MIVTPKLHTQSISICVELVFVETFQLNFTHSGLAVFVTPKIQIRERCVSEQTLMSVEMVKSNQDWNRFTQGVITTDQQYSELAESMRSC